LLCAFPPISTKQTITSKQWWSLIQPISTKQTITSKQWWSTIPPLSTKQTITSKQLCWYWLNCRPSLFRGDCLICWYWWIVDHHCLEVIVNFVDIGKIVDNHCLEVIVCFSQQFFQYQQIEQSPLNSDGQQFTNINKTNNLL
jgi:hypothetical protein